jgi:hypothetical protein
VGAQNAQNPTASIMIGLEPKSAHNGGSGRGYQELSAPLVVPTMAKQAGGRAVCFSLSHKPEAVSHGEIERSASLENSSLRWSWRYRAVVRPLANQLISQYEMSQHLCNRLVYAAPALGVNARRACA